MRKELVVFLETTEPDVELSTRFLKGDDSKVVLDFDGMRVATDLEALKKALFELEYFRTTNKQS